MRDVLTNHIYRRKSWRIYNWLTASLSYPSFLLEKFDRFFDCLHENRELVSWGETTRLSAQVGRVSRQDNLDKRDEFFSNDYFFSLTRDVIIISIEINEWRIGKWNDLKIIFFDPPFYPICVKLAGRDCFTWGDSRYNSKLHIDLLQNRVEVVVGGGGVSLGTGFQLNRALEKRGAASVGKYKRGNLVWSEFRSLRFER